MQHRDAIVIGRNEGPRLEACLASLAGRFRRVIYVDSGSTDGSQAAALRAGAELVALDLSAPFTAARARNAGLARIAPDPADFVQFLDGDCRLQPDWPDLAERFLRNSPQVAVVCGRRREVAPEASVYNRLIDLAITHKFPAAALPCGLLRGDRRDAISPAR